MKSVFSDNCLRQFWDIFDAIILCFKEQLLMAQKPFYLFLFIHKPYKSLYQNFKHFLKQFESNFKYNFTYKLAAYYIGT